MNKLELVKEVAIKTEMSQKAATKAVAAVFSVIEEALAKKDKVQIIGFGSFETRQREERKGRNPQTGEEITIPASKTPVFKAGKQLKNSLNMVAETPSCIF